MYKLILSIVCFCLFFCNTLPTSYAEDTNTEKSRYTAYWSLDYKNDNFSAHITTRKINFLTGKMEINSYDFADPSLKPISYTGAGQTESGYVISTPAGLKSYNVLRGSFYGGIIYEFDFETNNLRKVVEVDGNNRLSIFAQAGIYSIATPTAKDNEFVYKFYSLLDNSYLFANKKNAGELTNYIGLSKLPVDGNLIIEKDNNKVYTISYGGKLNEVSYKRGSNYGEGYPYTLPKGKLYVLNTVKNKKAYTKIEWESNKKRKVIFEDYGNTPFKAPFVSPSGKYMIVPQIQYGPKQRIAKQTIYIYDMQDNMKLVRKWDAHYRLQITKIKWYSDDLLEIFYYASNPSNYKPYYYSISQNTSTKSFDRMDSYELPYLYRWDNFSYENLTSLNDGSQRN